MSFEPPFPRERHFDAMVVAATQQFGVPSSLRAGFPALVKAIIGAESTFNPQAYKAEPQIGDASRGLMQVLERTARALGYTAPVGNDTTRTGGLYDPMTSIYLGTKLLTQNIAQARGNVEAAISAYNAGWSPTRSWDGKRTASGAFVNQSYVDRVKQFWAYYQRQPLILPTPGTPGAPTPTPPPGVTGSEKALVATWVGLALVALVYWLRRTLLP